MMIVLWCFLYLCIGAIVTFVLRRLHLIAEPRAKYTSDSTGYVVIGVFWIVTAPFAFALFFAEYGEKLKKRGKE